MIDMDLQPLLLKVVPNIVVTMMIVKHSIGVMLVEIKIMQVNKFVQSMKLTNQTQCGQVAMVLINKSFVRNRPTFQ